MALACQCHSMCSYCNPVPMILVSVPYEPEMMLMWVKIIGQHLLKWTTKQADVKMIKIVT
jgi:hypothetical protein